MKTRAPLHPAIEPLEARIAPAAIFHYTDVDGDKVTLTSSTGVSADLGNAAHVVGGQLQLLDLQTAMFGNEFRDADITLSVVKAGGGDGLANIGFINATGVDLGKVTIKGDLARIVAGDAVTADDPGVKSLNVRTLGVLGLATGAANLDSVITGALGTMKVARDFSDAQLRVNNGGIGAVKIGGDLTGNIQDFTGYIGSAGNIGSITIGGSLVGGGATAFLGLSGGSSAKIFSGADIGPVKIGGNLIGGGGGGSAIIESTGAIGTVDIRGSIVAGSIESGRIFAGTTLGAVKVGRDIIGGGHNSGQLRSGGAMGTVQIGGDLIGGPGSVSGGLFSGGAMGAVKIGGNLIGGKPDPTQSLNQSGAIVSAGRIVSVAITGAIFGGKDGSIGNVVASGAIIAGDDIGTISVGRGIFGELSAPVTIIARGQAVKPISGFDVAIGKITIKGDVQFARILAGFDESQMPANADASIGVVKVTKDWRASSIVAGAQDAGANGFGAGDTLQSVANTALVARIASITIGGDLTGTSYALDQFGFVAQEIVTLKIGGRAAALTAGKSNNAFPIAFTTDVAVLEV